MVNSYHFCFWQELCNVNILNSFFVDFLNNVYSSLLLCVIYAKKKMFFHFNICIWLWVKDNLYILNNTSFMYIFMDFVLTQTKFVLHNIFYNTRSSFVSRKWSKVYNKHDIFTIFMIRFRRCEQCFRSL